MSFEIAFGTMLDFATRGTNENALKSRYIADKLKAGNGRVIERLIFHIKQLSPEHPINQMFTGNSVLVPAPRSAPIIDEGLWPTNILCDHFVANGLGESVQRFLIRGSKVPRSSNFSSADLRPSCNTHFNSLISTPPIAFIDKIVLVDDIFTLGRTSCACVRKLKESYPNADISIFAAMRTRGFIQKLDVIVNPSYSSMSYNSRSDKVRLPD